MKYLIVVLLLSSYLYGQDKKIVYGNFVFQNQVYQYKCEKDKSIYKFSISSLEPTDVFKGFTLEQVNDVVKEITMLKNADTTKAGLIKEKIAKNIDPYFANISDILKNKTGWMKDVSSIDSTIQKVKDLHLKKSTAIDLLEAYKSFLNRTVNYNESTERIAQSLVLTAFRSNFNSAFSEVNNIKFKADTLDFIADEVFYSIKARMDFKDDEPLTAYLILKKKDAYIDFKIKYKAVSKANNNEKSDNILRDTVRTVKCKIDKVTVEFDEGTIKNIFIDVIPQLDAYNEVYGNNIIRYRNNMPISVSSKFDPDRFSRNNIISSNDKEMLEILNEKNTKAIEKSSILLSNILELKIVAENDKEDYSPANCVVELSETSTIVELKKEKRSRLFRAVAFSDLVGLNQNNQNGLVQIEVSRRCNINTGSWSGFFGIGKKHGRSYTNFLNYFTPVLSMNKIETNNKYLFLKKSNVDTVASFKGDSTNHFLVNQLDIYRYRTFNVQGNLNLFNWNLPNKKIAIHANYSVNYGSTLVTDSFKIKNHAIANTGTQNVERIGSFLHGPDVFIEYKPENRFGLTVGSTLGFINILSDNYKPNSNYKNGIVKIYATGFFKTNDDSKIFFRFAYNQTMASKGNNFYQLQLGYLIDLFTAGK